MNHHIKILFLVAILTISTGSLQAQQDPQYTQYMYNTMSVNPAYAGTSGVFRIIGLHRSQWVNLEGAPKTQTLGVDTSLGKRTGLGINIINDIRGPARETYFDANFSYTIPTGVHTSLSFGLKAGARLFNVDFSKGTSEQQGDPNLQNIDSKILPSFGAGIYLHHDTKWYLGLSVPNVLTSDYYNDNLQRVAEEQLHFFLIGAYVFDLTDAVKFKPAFLGKAVNGAPLSVDFSANFLIHNRLTLGVAYRWDDAVSALAGIQVNQGLFIGYGYDYTTSELKNVSNGSHELMLRFDFVRKGRIKSPRFF
ncbi:MAG: type IX secretion system membrane protein PorP/SprF [Flavobacteriaceae bacterium]|nr:type IX secretion system membrane protein PorP/SprF [Flavobacteriaceae bacterium]